MNYWDNVTKLNVVLVIEEYLLLSSLSPRVGDRSAIFCIIIYLLRGGQTVTSPKICTKVVMKQKDSLIQ